MYCFKCGSEIPDGVKFCTKCGASAIKNANAELHLSDNEVAAPVDDCNQIEETTLHNAVRKTQQRSRRIPIIVLVALSLALLSCVAYAAYRVYFEQPNTQLEQNEEAAEVANNNLDNETAQDVEQSEHAEQDEQAEERIEALDAYQDLIASYRYAKTDPDNQLFFNEHPLVNPVGISRSSYDSYALADLNHDSIPELLMGYPPIGARTYTLISEIYTYQNGEIVEIAANYGVSAAYLTLRENGVVMLQQDLGGAGQDYIYATLQDGPLSSCEFFSNGEVGSAWNVVTGLRWFALSGYNQDATVYDSFTGYGDLANNQLPDPSGLTPDIVNRYINNLAEAYPLDVATQWFNTDSDDIDIA